MIPLRNTDVYDVIVTPLVALATINYTSLVKLIQLLPLLHYGVC